DLERAPAGLAVLAAERVEGGTPHAGVRIIQGSLKGGQGFGYEVEIVEQSAAAAPDPPVGAAEPGDECGHEALGWLGLQSRHGSPGGGGVVPLGGKRPPVEPV